MTAEQQARDILERMGVEDAQSWSAGELVELANLIAERGRERWRNVKDRLPETDEPDNIGAELSADVLVFGVDDGEGGYGVGHYGKTLSDRPAQWHVQDEFGYPRNITHWMPLPEAPK